MSDLAEIKTRIYDEELVTDILEALECEYIKTEQNGQLFVAQLPSEYESRNKRAVQVKNNESLTSYIRNKGINGDIFSIIGFILFDCQSFDEVRENLYEIKAWLCNLFEWDEYLDFLFEPVKKKKQDWNSWLKPILKDRQHREEVTQNSKRVNKPIDKKIMNRFIQLPHIEFLKSGILCKTQKEFEVGFCIETQRVIYPIYDNNGENLVGIKGRYVGNNKHVAEEKKYLYLVPCDKSLLLYNFHRAKPFIEQKNEVLVFESAKSCMLAYQYGYKNAVSLEGGEMSHVQAYLLSQFHAKIIFCFDKDKSLEEIVKQIKLIPNRICYAILDKEDKLGEKDSPVDLGKLTWEFLYINHKYKLNCYKNHSRKEKVKK